jgi:hypothetical protein
VTTGSLVISSAATSVTNALSSIAQPLSSGGHLATALAMGGHPIPSSQAMGQLEPAVTLPEQAPDAMIKVEVKEEVVTSGGGGGDEAGVSGAIPNNAEVKMEIKQEMNCDAEVEVKTEPVENTGKGAVKAEGEASAASGGKSENSGGKNMDNQPTTGPESMETSQSSSTFTPTSEQTALTPATATTVANKGPKSKKSMSSCFTLFIYSYIVLQILCS